MARKPKSPSSLPQDDSVWYCAVRRIRTWVQASEDSDEYFRPWLSVVVHQYISSILHMNLYPSVPGQDEIHQDLVQSMLKPFPGSVSAHRPLEIHFEDRALADSLGPSLQELGIDSRFKPQTRKMDELIDLLNAQLGDENEDIPGLLQQRGVRVQQVGQLFDAARFFWHAQPWAHLLNEDLLAVWVGSQPEPTYVSVMGNGGEEFGLSLFDSVEDIEGFFSSKDLEEKIPQDGRHVFFFDKPPMVSFDDMDAVVKYGWELPAPDVYPTPVIFKPEETARPKAEMLRWYEAALRGIPLFVDQYVKPVEVVESTPVEAEFKVQTSAGDTRVHIRFPAIDQELVEKWISQAQPWFDENEMEMPVGMRGAMEGALRMYGAGLGGLDVYKDPVVYDAQEVMYDAWDEPNRSKRIKLAKKALKISPDCADAYVLLAQDTAATGEQALKLYQSGVDAGRRALGEDFFNDPSNIGYFWGILETRPFMRAVQGMATTLWELNRYDEAMELYRELLRLNPDDNQGNRYLLLDLLMEIDRIEDVERLLEDYREDWTADWAYSQALLSYRKHGDSRKPKQALKQALQVNQHVADYLTGKKRIPAVDFPYITMGGEDEAIDYASRHFDYWRKTPGAVAWLKRVSK